MTTKLLAAASLLFLCTAGCARLDMQTAGAERSWLQRHAHRVALEGDEFDDLRFLAPLLEGRRIVQLGENTHGAREYNLLKARLVRYLHQELDYDVLAFESALYQCYDADRTAAEAAPMSTLTSCAYGIWHTEEVLPLFEYLRESRTGGRPLHLAGIDVQPIGNNKADRPQFLSGIVEPFDAVYAAEVYALDSTFLQVYALGGRERRSYFRSDEGQSMASGYDSLASFLAAGPGTDSDALKAAERGVARQTARSMASYIRQQSAPTTREYVERRDEGMAKNLTFLLDELHPDRKIIVWGHNFHLRHDNLAIPPDSSMFPDVAARTMGSWIRERYGDQVYTVGLYAGRGQASNNSGEPYAIDPPDPQSLEGLLGDAGAGALFVDLSQAPRGRETSWMDRPLSARYNGTTPLPMIVRNQYDAILFVDEVTPRVMLY